MKNLRNNIEERPVKCSAHRPCWNAKLNDQELSDIEGLLTLVAEHKEQGLTATGIAQSWISRCIQPMKARERYGFDYLGGQNNDRISFAPLSDEEIMEQLQKIMNGVEGKPTTPKELSATTRPLEVCLKNNSIVISLVVYMSTCKLSSLR